MVDNYSMAHEAWSIETQGGGTQYFSPNRNAWRMNMSRIECFKDALERSKAALNTAPFLFPFKATIEQLQYLIDVEEGKTQDFSRLKDLKIGWIAVRELDGYTDESLIEELCVISAEIDKMMGDLGERDFALSE